MAGYNHYMGMSNNAVLAYSRGLKPLSKITIEDLKKAGVNITKKFAIWLAKNKYWPKAEWHHSGGNWYNEVDYYNPTDLLMIINSDEFKTLQIKYETSKQIDVSQRNVEGSYTIWGGSRKNPRRMGTQKFTGIKKGLWIYIDNNGGKKKADGNHIEWHYI